MTMRTAPTVAIVGAGPAGLMAAEALAQAGIAVDVYERSAQPARKFLLAGRGGLNLTHGEPPERFATRFGDAAAALAPALAGFGQQAVRDWAHGLGIDTFVGSSQRVFPVGMKASPLLRAWLRRLDGLGVRLHLRHRWLGFADGGGLRFAAPAGERTVHPAATVLALGGASWPRLGSDGAWVPVLEAAGVGVAPLQAANCGFDVAAAPAGGAPDRRQFLAALVGRDAHAEAAARPGWSAHFAERFAGQPLKSIAARVAGGAWQRGECVVTASGIEGSLVYRFAAPLRDAIARAGSATLELNLLPDWTADRLCAELQRPRGSRSLASHLQSRLGLPPVKRALLRELLAPEVLADPARLAGAIQSLPVVLAAPRPIAEAISSAGGVRLDAVDAHSQLRARPGTFVAGEMVDWEAPTGGYLLTACLAQGRHAAAGVRHFLASGAAIGEN